MSTSTSTNVNTRMDAVRGSIACNDLSPLVARQALRVASKDLSDRGLYVAARWATELLNAIPPETFLATSTPKRSALQHAAQLTFSPSSGFSPLASDGVATTEIPSAPLELPHPHTLSPTDAAEQDIYALGKAYFDAKEIERTSSVLRGCKGARARFLHLYARFLATEKRMQEDADIMMGPNDRLRTFRPEFLQLLIDIGDTQDPYELYLKAVILMRLNKRLQAIACLLQSGQNCPYNWSCWLKLATIIERQDELDVVTKRLPQSFMSRIFAIHAVLEIHAATDVLIHAIDDLLRHFPGSLHLKAQQALISYHLREFDDAEKHFDEIFNADPHRVDDIDTYSNILYVMEKRAKLASMAQKYVSLDRYRPETCCLIGNYYSLRGEHEKAIMHFRRALKLDRGYLSAWTLMGHEYVEMKNTHAAVEAYRRAIDVNRKDYRAWYGLGQTYELLDMHLYAVNYYQHATALRPYDTRMWTALGGCYERLRNIPEAVKAFKRAFLSAEPGEVPLLYRLANLANEQGHKDDFAAYHKQIIATASREDLPLAEYAKSYLVLARLEIDKGSERGDLLIAEQYLNKIRNSTLEDKEEAIQLLKRLRPLQLLL